MKKWMILAAAVVLAAPVFAQTQEAFPSYIQVNGRSQMEVTPDEFYLSIVINERESKGKITVEIQQRQMIDALKKLGVDVEKQLKVANMSSDFYKKASSLTTAKYQLLLHSAAEVGDVTAALGDLGISNVGIDPFGHRLPEGAGAPGCHPQRQVVGRSAGRGDRAEDRKMFLYLRF